MKHFIVIPAYNEEKHLHEIINRTKDISENIIIVDDGSIDNTFSIAKKSKVEVLRHIINLGKGAALRTGCDYAFSKGAECVIVMDSDGQHNPKLIKDFLENLEEVDVVLGYRVKPKEMPTILKIGNYLLNTTIKMLYGISVKDSQCGYRAFNFEAYKKIRWSSSDYSMESEMIAKIGKNKLKTRIRTP